MIEMEELTQQIKKTGVGVKIGEDLLSILLFADDVILLIETGKDMQKLLEGVRKFNEDIKMKFEIDKCKVMVINEKEKEGVNKNKQLQLSGKDVERVENYKYLW